MQDGRHLREDLPSVHPLALADATQPRRASSAAARLAAVERGA
jgi:hypothetical protein